jgi:hypothetical protein
MDQWRRSGLRTAGRRHDLRTVRRSGRRSAARRWLNFSARGAGAFGCRVRATSNSRRGHIGRSAWLIHIERALVRLAGHEDVRRWESRITDLFRRESDRWVRFDIHEDACVDPRGLDAVLAQLPSAP